MRKLTTEQMLAVERAKRRALAAEVEMLCGLLIQVGYEESPNYADYDAGLLNDFGGGNVEWWQDYLRAEIGRANEFWRQQVEANNG